MNLQESFILPKSVIFALVTPLVLCSAIIEASCICIGLPLIVCVIGPLEYLWSRQSKRSMQLCYFLEFTINQTMERWIQKYIDLFEKSSPPLPTTVYDYYNCPV